MSFLYYLGIEDDVGSEVKVLRLTRLLNKNSNEMNVSAPKKRGSEDSLGRKLYATGKIVALGKEKTSF